MTSTNNEPDQAKKTRKGYTPPKGRPTMHAADVAKRRFLSPTMEWVVAVIIMLMVLGAIIWLGADLGGGGGHNGAGTLVSDPVGQAALVAG